MPIKTVLITDYPWSNLEVERSVIEGSNLRLIAGSPQAAPAEVIAELAARHRPNAIMTCWAQVTAATIANCPSLEIVARIGVGLDNIDRAAAAAARVVVTNVPDYCIEEVSDHAVGFLLAWARGLVAFDRAIKRGVWDQASMSPRRVRDMTIGIAGFGRIGRRTAEKLVPFACRILVFDKEHPRRLPSDSMEYVDLEGMVSRSDAIVIHLPLTPETHGLFDCSTLGRMKPGSLLVNVSRGGLVDNDDLLDALENGPIDAAALDVVDGEPHPPKALIEHARVFATPHIAFSSTASLLELRRRAAEEVVRVLNGAAPNDGCPLP